MSDHEPVLLDLDFLLLDEPEPALTRGNKTPLVHVAETHRLAVSVEDERRRLRIISNRESARRSRIRRRRQLEGLRSEADRLRAQNRAVAGRLGRVNRSVLLFRRDNERLRSESAGLRRRLAEIRRLVLCWWLRRLPLPSAAAGGGYLLGKELMLASLMV
ncbi:basic leucine zipper 4-like [Musa acuminata AAA Group]|uniref:basic leucine zipper 4-like n=1 Tax=Musa acuminata AAA Group TaxID=214697 RepID=UPI0031D58445